jgi:hypothetical protein
MNLESSLFQNPNMANAAVFVSRKRNFIYVNVPKTGCTTIKKSLLAHELQLTEPELRKADRSFTAQAGGNAIHAFAKVTFQHPHDFEESEWKAFKATAFKFTCVRHPQVRVLSAYLDKLSGTEESRWQFRKIVLRGLGLPLDENAKVSWEQFIRSLAVMPVRRMNSHWRPQYAQTMYDSFEFDFIAKTETLDHDLNAILRRIYGAGARKLSDSRAHSVSADEQLDRFYTSESLATVMKVYRRDFALFGYEPIVPHGTTPPPLSINGQDVELRA